MTATTPAQHGTRQESNTARKPFEVRTLIDNRQARHLYEIEDTFTAGLILEGWEVKAILAGQANFNGGGSFVRIHNGEAFIDSMTVTALPQSKKGLLVDLNPLRERKLLLNRSELNKLERMSRQKGYTVVPLSLTFNGKLKLEIGLARGKKLADKRETLKERDIKRDMARDSKGL
jgi:SsrA-binding protein